MGRFYSAAWLIVGTIAQADLKGSGDQQLRKPIPPSLESIYGPPMKAMNDNIYQSWADRHQDRNRSDEYYAVRRPGNCKFPIDLMVYYDATASAQDNRDKLVSVEVPKMMEHLQSRHPGSRIGLLSLKDKPIPTLGETFDYCQRLDLPLVELNADKFRDALWTLWPNGGKDPAENQFGALNTGMYSKAANWSDNGHTRVALLLTDSWPHFADDGLNKYGLTVWEPKADDNVHCTSNYYPSPQQVRDALDDTETYLLSVVYDSDYQNDQPIKSWQWMNQFVVQPPEFVRDAKSDASNWWDIVSDMLETMANVECDDDTTTEPPTTKAPEPTTAAPTKAPEPTTEAPTKAPEPTTEAPDTTNECDTKCPPPEVLVKLNEKPKHLRLSLDN